MTVQYRGESSHQIQPQTHILFLWNLRGECFAVYTLFVFNKNGCLSWPCNAYVGENVCIYVVSALRRWAFSEDSFGNNIRGFAFARLVVKGLSHWLFATCSHLQRAGLFLGAAELFTKRVRLSMAFLRHVWTPPHLRHVWTPPHGGWYGRPDLRVSR